MKSQMKALLEEEAKNAKTIEEEIEDERRKVDAKTPITELVAALDALGFDSHCCRLSSSTSLCSGSRPCMRCHRLCRLLMSVCIHLLCIGGRQSPAVQRSLFCSNSLTSLDTAWHSLSPALFCHTNMMGGTCRKGSLAVMNYASLACG